MLRKREEEIKGSRKKEWKKGFLIAKEKKGGQFFLTIMN